MNEETKPRLLKRLDFEKNEFQANGKRYLIEGSLSIERYIEFQIIEKEMAYGFTTKSIYEKLEKVYQNMNKMKFAENAVLLYDLLKGITKIHEREPMILKICALFINEENEDRAKYSADAATKKIEDWKTEGYAIEDFFQLATSSVNGFLEIYQRVTQRISGLGIAPEKPDQK